MEVIQLLFLHQYSVHICSYSGPSGIFGSGRKQNTAEAISRGMIIFALSTDLIKPSLLFSYIVGSLLLNDPIFSRLFNTIKYSLRRN